jgi:hypothetical protein
MWRRGEVAGAFMEGILSSLCCFRSLDVIVEVLAHCTTLLSLLQSYFPNWSLVIIKLSDVWETRLWVDDDDNLQIV